MKSRAAVRFFPSNWTSINSRTVCWLQPTNRRSALTLSSAIATAASVETARAFAIWRAFPRNLVRTPGPRFKSTNSIYDLGCGPIEIDDAIFFLEDWGETGLRVVLRTRCDCPRLQARSVSTTRSAPMAASGGPIVSAVSSGAMGSSCCRRISPVSRPASMRIVVLPVTVSPFAIAH